MTTENLLAKGALTPRQTAEKYGIARSALFALMRGGELPRIKLSARRVVIPVVSVEAYLAQKMVKQG